MKTIPLCLIGFGNVGQAFARLLLHKKDDLAKKHEIKFAITAIATGRHGNAVCPEGLDLENAFSLRRKGESLQNLSLMPAPDGIEKILETSAAWAMLENTSVNYQCGQPALNYIQAALELGMHVVTANKGPVLYGYRSLSQLAAQKEVRFLFESSVMDGAPIFSLFRKTLPAVKLVGFEGILNSCTNLLLERMEAGYEFDQAVDYAHSIGITETDPGGDIDGWDAAIKTAILVNVLMGIELKLDEVERHGIREIRMDDILQAKGDGRRWKLICHAERDGSKVKASVRPEKVTPQSPFFNVSGTSSFVIFKTDCLPGLGILESNPSPETTAYGLLSDLLTIFG